jgi:dTDP-4-dehydrorhamnose 3,5-epimerase
MKFIQQAIPGVWVIEPKVYNDARGYFSVVFIQEL